MRIISTATLTQRQEIELAKLVELGDQDARNKLVEHNIPLVYLIARKYHHPDFFEDFISEGVVGLIRASEKFNWRKGFKFSTYATFWIRKYMSDFLRDKLPTIRAPYYVKNVPESVTLTELVEHYMEDPTTPNLDEEMDKESILKILQAVVEELPKTQQLIIKYYYGYESQPMTIKQISTKLRLTPEEVMLELDNTLKLIKSVLGIM